MQRISLITLNLWNTEYWQQRRSCVVSFVQTYQADIYCFQEVREQTLCVLDSALSEYKRIEGTDEGWRCENSIYVKKSLFTILDYGRVDLQMPEIHRGVFWVRLRRENGQPLFVATMHLTHQLNADELRTGIGYRHNEAHLAAKALNLLVGHDDAIICGDFNDPVHPARIFSQYALFIDVFSALGLCAPVTFPCPYLSKEGFMVEAIDKIMIRGAIRTVLATSPHYINEGKVLSDHWPVCAVLELSD